MTNKMKKQKKKGCCKSIIETIQREGCDKGEPNDIKTKHLEKKNSARNTYECETLHCDEGIMGGKKRCFKKS